MVNEIQHRGLWPYIILWITGMMEVACDADDDTSVSLKLDFRLSTFWARYMFTMNDTKIGS